MIKYQLTTENFKAGLTWLAETDPDLGLIIKKHGPPPMWNREPGFPTLVHIVLEQQVSLASAKAAFERLKGTLPFFTPKNFLKIDDITLIEIGFSRQKRQYCRNIALAIENEELFLEDLPTHPDDVVRNELQKIIGIGRWTADIYLLMALNRPDIWPVGDLALVSALQVVKNLTRRPSTEEFEIIGESWKPWRAVAARILWHQYLS